MQGKFIERLLNNAKISHKWNKKISKIVKILENYVKHCENCLNLGKNLNLFDKILNDETLFTKFVNRFAKFLQL